MKITEQWTRGHRQYFRGERQGAYQIFDEFYVTTHSSYAFLYAKKYGKVTEYRLKKDSNIFNLKCASDEGNLRKYLQLKPALCSLLSKIDYLKNNDWSGQLGGDSSRQDLIDIIKDLGYDGYFNYEYDKMLIKMLWKEGIFDVNYTHKNQPGIAFFNKNALIEVDSWQGEKLTNSEFYTDLHQKELQALFEHTWDKTQNLDELNTLIPTLAKGFITMPTSDDVIKAMLNEVDYSDNSILYQHQKEQTMTESILSIAKSRGFEYGC